MDDWFDDSSFAFTEDLIINIVDQTDDDYFLLEFSWHFLFYFYFYYYMWKTLIFSHDAAVVHGLLWTIFS